MGKRKVAILNPLGDYGFNTYNLGLAEGLGQAGWEVELITCGSKQLFAELPPARHHRRSATCGSFRIRKYLPAFPRPAIPKPMRRKPVRQTEADGTKGSQQEEEAPAGGWRARALTGELLLSLKLRGFDWLWTQWPAMDPYSPDLRLWAKQAGLRVAHTVHNVLPHEVGPKDRALCGRVYRESDLLFVHSEAARARLREEFPELEPAKIAMYRMGAMEMYPRRVEERERWRGIWRVGQEQRVWLVAGLIRPYKNVDAVLEAFAGLSGGEDVLVVQGKESGFAGASAEEPLGNTQRKARELGIEDRVRWLPGFVSMEDMSGLMEAADGLLLPYKEGYGSSLLSVGMVFGLHIVSAPVGGAQEYLEEYGWGTLLESTDAGGIGEGLRRAGERLAQSQGFRAGLPESLRWTEAGRVAAGVLDRMSRQ